MRTIAFYNLKGGVGKTTSTVNVAHIMATVHNKKVLVIDLDPQANTSKFFGFIKTDDAKNYDVGIDNLLKGDADIHEGIQKTAWTELDIIPSCLRLATVDRQLLTETTMPQQFILSSLLANVRDDYDYCIIDCSPALTISNTNALYACNDVIVPMLGDEYAKDGLTSILGEIKAIKKYNINLDFAFCFYTQWTNTLSSQNAYERVREMVGNKLLDIKIRRTTVVSETSQVIKDGVKTTQIPRIPLLEWAPQATATKDYLQLTKYIVEHYK